MPIYQYKCQECQKEFEELRSMNLGNTEDPNRFTTCPACDGKAKKQLTTSHFRIKGFSEANGYAKQA